MVSVLGFAAMPILVAPILGPVIAGAILQFASWQWLFLVNLPVGALALVLGPHSCQTIVKRQGRATLIWLAWLCCPPSCCSSFMDRIT